MSVLNGGDAGARRLRCPPGGEVSLFRQKSTDGTTQVNCVVVVNAGIGGASAKTKQGGEKGKGSEGGWIDDRQMSNVLQRNLP